MRAYSMANHPAEGDIVMLNIRIATPPIDRKAGGWEKVNPGLASSYTFALDPGDKVTISGPYGEFYIQETEREMCYIGGGAGMAPLRSHLFHLFHTEGTQRKVSYWYGARSSKELFYEDHFRGLEEKFPNFSFHVAMSEPAARGQLDRPHRVHPPGRARGVPQQAPGAGGHRVLPLRPSHDAHGGPRHARRSGRRRGDDPLRRLRQLRPCAPLAPRP